MKPLPISTERIKLRRAAGSDAEILFHNYCSDVYSSKFLMRKPHSSVDQTRKFLNNWCDTAWDNELDQFGWVIALAETNEAVGIFLVILEGHKAQIHFGISRNFEGDGLMTESAKAVVQWLMNQQSIQRIWAVCDLLNKRSINVLEKTGFQRECILRKWLILPAFGESARDCYAYSQIF